jgi:hypothetical protein
VKEIKNVGREKGTERERERERENVFVNERKTEKE